MNVRKLLWVVLLLIVGSTADAQKTSKKTRYVGAGDIIIAGGKYYLRGDVYRNSYCRPNSVQMVTKVTDGKPCTHTFVGNWRTNVAKYAKRRKLTSDELKAIKNHGKMVFGKPVQIIPLTNQ